MAWLFFGPSVNLIVCAENVHYGFLPLDVYGQDCFPTETIPTDIGQTCLLDCAVYHKPFLLVQLYAITPTSHSSHSINMQSPWCVEASLTHLSQLFCVCTCLSVLHSLTAPVRSITGTMQDTAQQQ